ncbi:cyclin-like protein, partial [Hyaloraphidium curvatum]
PYATDDVLLRTPSRRDGVPEDLETDLRLYACELVQSAGMLLGLPQVAMATAQVLVQRFFYLSSMRKHSVRDIAMGALFLAAKVEETPRRIRDIVLVFDHVIKRARGQSLEPVEMFDAAFFELRNGLVDGEMHLLRGLGFNVQVQHPHGIMVNYLQSLGLSSNRELCQKAWNCLNDQRAHLLTRRARLRTPISVAYPVHTVACAAIWLAARQIGIALPTVPPWWQVFDAELEDLETISLILLDLYARRVPEDRQKII